MKVKFPDKLAFLSEPHRYKVLYGNTEGSELVCAVHLSDIAV